jgi:hypothetical protein
MGRTTVDPRGQKRQPQDRKYNHTCEHPDEVEELDEMPAKGLVLQPVFSGDKFREIVQYPVIVERWDQVAGRNARGRAHRQYLAEFTEAERKVLGHYYGLFYRWYLVSGTPKRVVLRLKTLQLLQRACNFFATAQ